MVIEMKRFGLSLVFALASGMILSAQAGSDLSGRWNRDPTSGATGSADGSGWGSRIDIALNGGNLTVQPASGSAERYRLDGTETAEVILVRGCLSQTRIAKALIERGQVTITTWLVTKAACFHGEDDDDPMVKSTGPIAVHQVLGGPRRLESITFVYREGAALIVDSMRSAPGGAPVSTTTTYRK